MNSTAKLFSEIFKIKKKPRYISIVERWANDPTPFKILNDSIKKFNPYHDELGRFSSSNGANSFSASQWQLVGWKEKKESFETKTTQSGRTQRGHINVDGYEKRFETVKAELSCDDKQADAYFESVSNFTTSDCKGIRAYQQGDKNFSEFENDANIIEDYISKAPQWNGGTLYRGINLKDGNVEDVFKPGAELDMQGTSSWSSDVSISEMFTSGQGKGTKVIFQCDKISKATSVKHLSWNSYENEVLASKDTKYVSKGFEKKGKYYYVYLDEIAGVAKSFSELAKFNPYHDRLGRFTTADGAKSMTIRTRWNLWQNTANKAIEREKERTEGKPHINGSKTTLRYDEASRRADSYAVEYKPYKRGQISKIDAGQLYKAVKNENVKALPETVNSLYKQTDAYILFATERYTQDSRYYDSVERMTRALLNNDYEAAQTFINYIEDDRISRAAKKSPYYKYRTSKSFKEVFKFNPYHDSLGMFTSSGNATSFTYKPGASTAHSKAIENEKAKANSEQAETKGFKGTLYHGSPNKDIQEFDMSRAGQNTSSGEKLLFFTDSKQMADDFSYERLDGSSTFFQRRGEKGRVYEVDVEMKNPLDFRKLSDKDIDNVLKLDSEGLLTKEIIQSYANSNHQLLKAGLTLTSDSLKELGYDGLIANTGKAGHNSLEYAVVDSKQAKIRKGYDEMSNEQGLNPPFYIQKADADKRLVFGWALVSADRNGETIVDHQGDMIEQEELEQGAYEYVLNFRDAGEEHNAGLRKKARMVESVVFTDEKLKAMGIPTGTVPNGWWIGFYVDDDKTWELIKNGTYKMFSIEGRAIREPVTKALRNYEEFPEYMMWLEENLDATIEEQKAAKEYYAKKKKSEVAKSFSELMMLNPYSNLII